MRQVVSSGLAASRLFLIIKRLGFRVYGLGIDREEGCPVRFGRVAFAFQLQGQSYYPDLLRVEGL